MTNKWELIKKIFICAAPLVLSACASQLLAIGDWSEPADLHLNKESLAGVKVAVRCVQSDKNGKVQNLGAKTLCAGLERHFAALGANVIKAEQETADYTLWYVDQGVVEKHVSGTSVLGFNFTVGIIPIVSSSTSRAELQVRDGRDVILERRTVEIAKVEAFGWSSLIATELRQRNRELGQKFYRFAENRVVSQATGLVHKREAP